MKLESFFFEIPGWKLESSVPLDFRITDALKLDDYLNATYSNGRDTVSLYIGYYYTAKKLGAAHDPLVCFPGQGWVVSQKKNGSILVKTWKLNYSTMVVTRDEDRRLVLYWFQSYEKSNPNTFSQKLTSLYNRILHRKEDNAFVRITVGLNGKTEAKGTEIALNFIKTFYPQFLSYIKNENNKD